MIQKVSAFTIKLKQRIPAVITLALNTSYRLNFFPPMAKATSMTLIILQDFIRAWTGYDT